VKVHETAAHVPFLFAAALLAVAPACRYVPEPPRDAGGDVRAPGGERQDGPADAADAAGAGDAPPASDAGQTTDVLVADAGAPEVAGADAGDVAPLSCPPGFGDCNGNQADGCEAALDSVERCGGCNVRCDGSKGICQQTAGMVACREPAQALEGARFDLPCGALTQGGLTCADLPPGASACPRPDGHRTVDKRITFGGQPGRRYAVTLRFRGLVERRFYTGGTAMADRFYVGGMPTAASGGYSTMSLTVSSPPQVYYLNNDQGEGNVLELFVLNHMKTINIDAGATIRLESVNEDCNLARNCVDVMAATCVPQTVPGFPMPYNGQFIQIDVSSVKPAS
jgi:hypothetical protein